MARQKPPKKVSSNVSALDRAAKSLLSSLDPGYSERELLSDREAKIQGIMSDELNLAKSVSNGNILDFVKYATKDTLSGQAIANGSGEIDAYSLFTENISSIFGYYEELYKNRYTELADLKMISKFIPAIGEAVKTTLDSIVSADDFSDQITRNLDFGAGLTEAEKATVAAEVERIEKSYKLPKKLKNIVYKKTLVSGNHFVYCIPYSELFGEYDRLRKSGKILNNGIANNAIGRSKMLNTDNKNTGFNLNGKDVKKAMASESADYSYLPDDFSEESKKFICESLRSLDCKDDERKYIRNAIVEGFSNIEVLDTVALADAFEAATSQEAMQTNLAAYRNMFDGVGVVDDNQYVDGTVSSNEVRPEKFDIDGCYIKYIDASKIVPIKVFDTIVGYFYVHDTTVSKKAASVNMNGSTSSANFMTGTSSAIGITMIPEDRRNQAAQTIINTIAEGIISNFSNKFVVKNADFKRTIADCITANGLINNNFQIQFIPAKYIVPFVINEDEDNRGRSILEDALFPAKLLLSLLVSKLLLYMNKSGSKTIAYISKGPINVSTGNHIQRVVRNIQESNITFSDLLSTNLSFSKFGRNNSINIPKAKDGTRLIEFETQEGQEIDLRTPMEEFLEKLAIMGTGVPSVILEYTDAADYAKSIVTANIKFASRVASLDSDLEEPTTELYKKILATSKLDPKLLNKVLSAFKFKLARPKVLNNANVSDYMSQVDSLSQSIAKLFYGDNPTEDQLKARDKFIKHIAMDCLPFVQWDKYADLFERASIDAVAEKDLDQNSNAGGDEGTDNDF